MHNQKNTKCRVFSKLLCLHVNQFRLLPDVRLLLANELEPIDHQRLHQHVSVSVWKDRRLVKSLFFLLCVSERESKTFSPPAGLKKKKKRKEDEDKDEEEEPPENNCENLLDHLQLFSFIYHF